MKMRDFIRAMTDAFTFPQNVPEEDRHWYWYTEHMSRLGWIKQKEIVFIIHNYDQMLVDNFKVKKNIIEEFDEVTLPWWGGEIIGCQVGGEPKKFSIYLESTQASSPDGL